MPVAVPRPPAPRPLPSVADLVAQLAAHRRDPWREELARLHRAVLLPPARPPRPCTRPGCAGRMVREQAWSDAAVWECPDCANFEIEMGAEG